MILYARLSLAEAPEQVNFDSLRRKSTKQPTILHIGHIVHKRMHEYFLNFLLFFEGPIVSCGCVTQLWLTTPTLFPRIFLSSPQLQPPLPLPSLCPHPQLVKTHYGPLQTPASHKEADTKPLGSARTSDSRCWTSRVTAAAHKRELAETGLRNREGVSYKVFSSFLMRLSN